MPCRPSVSTSSTVRPSAASARARAAATVVFPVPPLPVTTWQRTGGGSGLTVASLGGCGPTGPSRSAPGRTRRPSPVRAGASVLPHERTGSAQVGVRHDPAADPQHQGDPRLLGGRRLGAGDRAPGPGWRGPAGGLPEAPHQLRTPPMSTPTPTDSGTQSWHDRLAELGIRLPPVAAPVSRYVPAVRTGNLVYTSGQLP